MDPDRLISETRSDVRCTVSDLLGSEEDGQKFGPAGRLSIPLVATGVKVQNMRKTSRIQWNADQMLRQLEGGQSCASKHARTDASRLCRHNRRPGRAAPYSSKGF